MRFIETNRLMGKGLGYVDIHLLASAVLTSVPLWTLDKGLSKAAAALGIKY
jgi:predicted nucleic acid-binding protein